MAESIDFKYISPELYRHSGEKEAVRNLEKIPGFRKAIDMMAETIGGQAERQAEIASMARVGAGVYPALHSLWSGVQDNFGLQNIPLHLTSDSDQCCAIRGGNDHPAVVMFAGLLDLLPEREMAALLAMQAGAVRLGNATYLAAADFLRRLSDFSGIAGAPAAVLAWGMENWRRYAAFSSDRAAALSAGNPDAAVALLERMSGAGSKAWGGVAEPDALRVQGVEALSLNKDWSNSRWRRFNLAMNRQNHVGLIRRADLLDWFSSGAPGKILAGEIKEPCPDEAKAADADGAASASHGFADPGLAYWGEFASSQPPPADNCKKTFCPVSTVMGMAEKGLSSFWRAGEAFIGAFQDKR